MRVYPDGGVYLQFRTDGLFGPVRGVHFADVRARRAGSPTLPASDARRALGAALLKAEFDFANYTPEEGEAMPAPEAQLTVGDLTIDVGVSGDPAPELWFHQTQEPDFFAELVSSAEKAGSSKRPQRESNPR